VRLGTFGAMLHRGRVPFEFALDWTLPQKLVIPDPTRPGTALFSGAKMGFRTRIAAAKSRARMRVERQENSYELQAASRPWASRPTS
jgi:hypothetical protein